MRSVSAVIPHFAAIEMIARPVLPSEAFSRAGIGVPQRAALLVVQVEMPSEESPALQRLGDLLGRCGVEHDPLIALTGDDRTASRFFELREAVPAAVN